jgi:hypothetical protein
LLSFEALLEGRWTQLHEVDDNSTNYQIGFTEVVWKLFLPAGFIRAKFVPVHSKLSTIL